MRGAKFRTFATAVVVLCATSAAALDRDIGSASAIGLVKNVSQAQSMEACHGKSWPDCLIPGLDRDGIRVTDYTFDTSRVDFYRRTLNLCELGSLTQSRDGHAGFIALCERMWTR